MEKRAASVPERLHVDRVALWIRDGVRLNDAGAVLGVVDAG